MSRTPPALGKTLRSGGLRLAALAALWTVAGALRLEGVKWGIPNWTRFYPYHPDESVLLHAACQLNPLWGDFAPSFYNYGSLYILFCRVAYDFAAPLMGWGAVPGDPSRFTDWLWPFSRLLAVGRLVNVGMGIALVGVTLLLARLLWTRAAGWWAGIFLAVAPMPVLLGRYMTVDFPATFLATFALAFAAAALRARSPRQRLGWVTASAGAIALSAGTKYHVFVAPMVLALAAWDRWGLDDLGWPPWLPLVGGAFAAGIGFAPLWVVHWETWRERRKLAPVALALLLSGVAFAICFLISTPGCLLEFETFWRDLRWEMGRNREGMGYLFEATPPSAIYHLTVSLPIALEWPLYLLCVAGAGWSLVRRRREDLLLWLFVLPTFGALALSERKFLRYVAPLLPPLVVLAGRLLAELGAAGEGRRRGVDRPRRDVDDAARPALHHLRRNLATDQDAGHQVPLQHCAQIVERESDAGGAIALPREGQQDPAHVVYGSDAAADRERHEHLVGDLTDDIGDVGALLVGRGDVEEDQLVGAGRVVDARLLDRVARIA